MTEENPFLSLFASCMTPPHSASISQCCLVHFPFMMSLLFSFYNYCILHPLSVAASLLILFITIRTHFDNFLYFSPPYDLWLLSLSSFLIHCSLTAFYFCYILLKRVSLIISNCYSYFFIKPCQHHV